MIKINNDWENYFEKETKLSYYQNLREFLKREYQTQTVYPSMHDIFSAFKYTSFSDVKVVILGQDPYHGAGQAHGLSFSVEHGIKIPPSLKNIYKELASDIGMNTPNHGNLEKWATQGVLLLNTTLTVRESTPMSHKGKGWETFTDNMLKYLNTNNNPIVYLLWGSHARSKTKLITNPNHLILEAPHPSPLSAHRGFFGCKHFSKANDFIKSKGLNPIDWNAINN